MEFFWEKKSFCKKLTRKHLCCSLFLIKLKVSILQLHWKKGLQHRCFQVNFARYLRHLFDKTSVLRKKYFINKIVKNPLRKRGKNENSLSGKQSHKQNKNFTTIYIKSSYPLTLSRRRPLSHRNRTGFYMITASVLKGLTIQKCLYFSFLCFPWYIENTSF